MGREVGRVGGVEGRCRLGMTSLGADREVEDVGEI